MQVLEKPAFKVIGIKVTAEWDALWVEMPAAWDKFFASYHSIIHRVNDTMMDICLHTYNRQYSQLLCVEVTTFNNIPRGVMGMEIPHWTYIHHCHVGALAEIADSFARMYEWADQNGYQSTDFKLDIGYTPSRLEQEHDLYIRILT